MFMPQAGKKRAPQPLVSRSGKPSSTNSGMQPLLQGAGGPSRYGYQVEGGRGGKEDVRSAFRTDRTRHLKS
ncbi:hypothetical protein GCM10010121_083520 [Streptomyces brasiliensis]|uniref:Uncharacterized protein n=1 Tax=Streptomyces brasiliensis TaxID=1954 RepID=A0A917LCG1_9ACTN|nr:hypothetical protein GCM10010121_083520 [Streptomyces brasiliensis]